MKFLMIQSFDLLQQFLWPFIRVSALFLTAPIFGANAFNLSTRIALGAAITVLIFQHVEIPTISPFSYDAIVLMFNEIVVGSFMGLVLQLVTAAVILSGQVVSGGMGLGMANMIDPNLGNIPTLSNFFLVLALLAFLSLGGHLILISLLFDSFTQLPIGGSLLSMSAIESFIAWSSNMFIGAVALILPVVVCLLMVNVCLGVISRASPSLNIFAVGFPALIPIGLVLITITTSFYFSRLESIWYSSFQFLQTIVSR